MLMDAEIKNAVCASDTEAQYDEKAKRLLGNKIILAHILAKTVDEFRGMDPKDVVPYIEGEPLISMVPVESGLTNASNRPTEAVNGSVISKHAGSRIVGLNTENTEINEGLIRFDIIFYVRMKDGNSKVIINLETQYDIPVNDKIREDVSEMCNLSQGILEKGEARGKTIGEAKIILSMHRKGYTLEQIADVAEKDREQIEAIIEKGEPAMV